MCVHASMLQNVAVCQMYIAPTMLLSTCMSGCVQLNGRHAPISVDPSAKQASFGCSTTLTDEKLSQVSSFVCTTSRFKSGSKYIALRRMNMQTCILKSLRRLHNTVYQEGTSWFLVNMNVRFGRITQKRKVHGMYMFWVLLANDKRRRQASARWKTIYMSSQPHTQHAHQLRSLVHECAHKESTQLDTIT